MKHLLYIIIFATLNNCKAQNNPEKEIKLIKQDTIMNVFDIKKFNSNKNDLNQFSFKLNETTTASQRELKDEYIEVIKSDTSLFEDFKSYHKNGNLKASVKRYPNSFLKGELKEYDKDSNLINIIDHDEPFNFTWRDIEAFLMAHEVKDLKKNIISIRRFNENKTSKFVRKGPYWQLEFKGRYKDLIGQFSIELDGITGEELLVKRFRGKGPKGNSGTIALYDTIYEKE